MLRRVLRLVGDIDHIVDLLLRAEFFNLPEGKDEAHIAQQSGEVVRLTKEGFAAGGVRAGQSGSGACMPIFSTG